MGCSIVSDLSHCVRSAILAMYLVPVDNQLISAVMRHGFRLAALSIYRSLDEL